MPCWATQKLLILNIIFQEKESVVKVIGPIEKQIDEEDEEYYTRIFQRKEDESDESFETRIQIIKRYLPTLKIWKKDSYKSYITVVKTTRTRPIHTKTTTTITRVTTSSSSPAIIDVSFNNINEFAGRQIFYRY